MIRNDVYFGFNEGLSRAAEAINSENSDCAEESACVEQLSLLNVSCLLPSLWWTGCQELNYTDRCNISNDGPAKGVPDPISLGLHKKSVALLSQLVEGNLRLVLIFVFVLN